MSDSKEKYQRRRQIFSVLLLLIIFILISVVTAGTRPSFPKVHSPFVKIPPGYYQVTKFYDGDTIEVDMNGNYEKVRMIGVDTPETHDPRKAVQCFGQAASDFTKKLIGTSPVRLKADPQNSNRDRYNRLLRYVYLPDGTLVNSKIISEGYGFTYTYFPFSKLEEFKTHQREAEKQNKGLWGSCQIITEPSGAVHTNNQ